MTQLTEDQKMDLDAPLNLNCREAFIVTFAVDDVRRNDELTEDEAHEVFIIMVDAATVMIEEKRKPSYSAPFNFKVKHIITILYSLDNFMHEDVDEKEIDAILDKIDNVMNPLIDANP